MVKGSVGGSAQSSVVNRLIQIGLKVLGSGVLGICALVLNEGRSIAFEQGLSVRYCLNRSESDSTILFKNLGWGSATSSAKSSAHHLHPLLKIGAEAEFETSNSLSAGEQTTLLMELLEDFHRIFLENPIVWNRDLNRNFKSESQVKNAAKNEAITIYRHLCQDRDFKSNCKKFKSSLVDFFTGLSLTSAAISSGANTANSAVSLASWLEKLNQEIVELRQKFIEARTAIRGQMALMIFEGTSFNPQIKNYHDYNAMLLELLSLPNVSEKIDAYERAYFRLASSSDRAFLTSRTLLRRVEGYYYHLTFSDLILAVDELGQDLRHDFEELVLGNPELLSYFERRVRNPDFKDDFDSESVELSFAAGVPHVDLECSRVLHAWFQSSQAFPSRVGAKAFEALQRFFVADLDTVEFLAQRQYQRAIWRLRDIGQIQQAERMEEWIDQEVLRDDDVERGANLGGGFTTTTLISFPYGVRGVYKPAPSNFFTLQGFRDSVAGNYKREVAAYEMDRLLDLRQVPLTKVVNFPTGRGSVQLFVDHTTLARKASTVDPEHPVAPGKWSQPEGRAVHLRNVKFFDWLISNWDRNLDNYLLADEGRCVLIDHGCSFELSLFPKISSRKLRPMIPSRRIYQNLLDLQTHPSRLDEKLGALLDPYRLWLLKLKIKSVVGVLGGRIEREGMDAVFAEADEEDRKGMLN